MAVAESGMLQDAPKAKLNQEILMIQHTRVSK
jgi:hypothetical protein